jgi:hypothetical protein
MKCPKCGRKAEIHIVNGQRHCLCEQCGTFRIPEGLDSSAKEHKQVPLWRQLREGEDPLSRKPKHEGGLPRGRGPSKSSLTPRSKQGT